MEYDLVIGIEVHTELSTKAKAFCNCKVSSNDKENTNICPICMGLPGSLPKLNEEVLNYAIKAGLALNCGIQKNAKHDRKNYFYADLVKGYQITQAEDNPIAKNGYISLSSGKKVRINRIQIEEDTAKINYDAFGRGMLLDFNRSSVPLIEIISEPDMNSSEEAIEYLEKLREILVYIGITSARMEEGEYRADINISVNKKGEDLGNRVEIKNMNSFRSILRAIEYEKKRQIDLIEKGEIVTQETLGWDDVSGQTFSMRLKGTETDYKYFPEPDLPKLEIDEKRILKIKEEIPELPDIKRQRFIEKYNLTNKQLIFIFSDKYYLDFFEEVISKTDSIHEVANWMMSDIARLMNEKLLNPEELPISIDNFVKFINLINENVLNSKTAKEVMDIMFETNKDPEIIVKEEGLSQISDQAELEKIVLEILGNNPQSIEDFKEGKDKALGFLVGQSMKATKGKGNPQIINKIIKEYIEKN